MGVGAGPAYRRVWPCGPGALALACPASVPSSLVKRGTRAGANDISPAGLLGLAILEPEGLVEEGGPPRRGAHLTLAVFVRPRMSRAPVSRRPSLRPNFV